MRAVAWDLDPARPLLLTPAEVRRELGVSARTFAYYRARHAADPTWRPAERRPRGYRGEICLYSPDQVERMRGELVAARAGTRAPALGRLGHARVHRLELQELAQLAWEVVRAGPLGDSLRRIGCDVPLKSIPRGRRARARAEIERVLHAPRGR